MSLLDGKYLSEKLKQAIATEAAQFSEKTGKKPHLAAILVGKDGASETYVASKMKSCEQVGLKATLVRCQASLSEGALLAHVEDLNKNASIDGIIIQLPLPKHINTEKVTEKIDYRKDVDGFHPINLGRMQRNLPAFIPATPLGILLMLEEYAIETEGKHCVIVGRSNLVGLPMSILMTRNSYPGNCTVTTCHSKTSNLKAYTTQADILITAVGQKKSITACMVKKDAVVIDVGITRETTSSNKYKLYGDVDFEQVQHKASWITPVPGGVGLMTVTALLKNTLLAAKKEIYDERSGTA